MLVYKVVSQYIQCIGGWYISSLSDVLTTDKDILCLDIDILSIILRLISLKPQLIIKGCVHMKIYVTSIIL